MGRAYRTKGGATKRLTSDHKKHVLPLRPRNNMTSTKVENYDLTGAAIDNITEIQTLTCC